MIIVRQSWRDVKAAVFFADILLSGHFWLCAEKLPRGRMTAPKTKFNRCGEWW